MLDQAFEALKSYDWGSDREALRPIEETVVAIQDDSAARKQLETRLAAVLTSDVSRDAKDYVCRQLRIVGATESIPTLAALLSDPELSHMSRYALQCIPTPEAAGALREALPRLEGDLKIGVISSIGARQDKESTGALEKLLTDSDEAIARSAALALGAIGAPSAVRPLLAAVSQKSGVRIAATDATLACADAMLAAGNKAAALAAYKGLAATDSPKHVRLAATRGMLACAGKSE